MIHPLILARRAAAGASFGKKSVRRQENRWAQGLCRVVGGRCGALTYLDVVAPVSVPTAPFAVVPVLEEVFPPVAVPVPSDELVLPLPEEVPLPAPVPVPAPPEAPVPWLAESPVPVVPCALLVFCWPEPSVVEDTVPDASSFFVSFFASVRSPPLRSSSVAVVCVWSRIGLLLSRGRRGLGSDALALRDESNYQCKDEHRRDGDSCRDGGGTPALAPVLGSSGGGADLRGRDGRSGLRDLLDGSEAHGWAAEDCAGGVGRGRNGRVGVAGRAGVAAGGGAHLAELVGRRGEERAVYLRGRRRRKTADQRADDGAGDADLGGEGEGRRRRESRRDHRRETEIFKEALLAIGRVDRVVATLHVDTPNRLP